MAFSRLSDDLLASVVSYVGDASEQLALRLCSKRFAAAVGAQNSFSLISRVGRTLALKFPIEIWSDVEVIRLWMSDISVSKLKALLDMHRAKIRVIELSRYQVFRKGFFGRLVSSVHLYPELVELCWCGITLGPPKGGSFNPNLSYCGRTGPLETVFFDFDLHAVENEKYTKLEKLCLAETALDAASLFRAIEVFSGLDSLFLGGSKLIWEDLPPERMVETRISTLELTFWSPENVARLLSHISPASRNNIKIINYATSDVNELFQLPKSIAHHCALMCRNKWYESVLHWLALQQGSVELRNRVTALARLGGKIHVKASVR
mmetsp:Transcript_11851/g.21125  ORF Transcript_11851/g.21125 Transcript_11851/m.21125 type:complete len:321 (+) Transcript_11851:507-1469(+)